MKRFLPLLAAGLLGALFAGVAVYWELRAESARAAGPSPAGPDAPAAGGCGGTCCGEKG